MNKYTIYCTESQVRKAMALGAPISADTQEIKFAGINGLPFDVDRVVIPTAEQMIGWLEEQGVWIHFCKPNQRPNLLSFSVSNINEPFRREFVGGEYSSRRDATLTAIDAALDYLVKIKEEKE